MKRSIIIYLLLFFAMNTFYAADNVFKVFDTSDGLPDNTVKCITQDSLGFIWMGTFNGLCRFDGKEFITYRHNPADENSIANNHMEALLATGADLWIGTENGLNRYDFAKDCFHPCHIQTPEGEKQLSSPVRNIIDCGGVTEYGSEISSDRPGEYNAKWGCIEQNEGWKGYPWRSGQVSWCAFDHGSIAGSTMAKLGIIDYFRIPKRYWYWYRNEYAGIAPPEWPTDNAAAKLKLEASGTTAKTDGTDDIQLVVTVCDASGKWVSQSPDVELRIVSGPGEFPTGRSIRFEADSDIRIQDGQAAIAIRSYYAGKTIVEAVSEGLEPARVTIRFEGETEYQEV